MTNSVRVGIDLVQISEIARSISTFGARFTTRLFTTSEADYCQRQEHSAAAHFAARFAAKEATLKVLRPGADWIDRRSIAVRRHSDGWCELVLHNGAAARAELAGLHSWSVSLTHEADFAAAVVVAVGAEPFPGDPPGHTLVPASMLARAVASISALPPGRTGLNIMNERIRGILDQHGRLAVSVPSLQDTSDLYRAGMTSHASVNVMLALEDEFELEFPDRMLRRDVFGSIGAIQAALAELVDLRDGVPAHER